MYRLDIDSPLGPLRLVSDGTHLCGVYTDAPLEATATDRPELEQARVQLQEYFSGSRREFDLPLAPRGTPFQLKVWNELRSITFGQTSSYGELAARLGTSARAVGNANGKNPIAIIVPCHRVIGGNGKLVGYAGGLERKAWLLEHEAGSSSYWS